MKNFALSATGQKDILLGMLNDASTDEDRLEVIPQVMTALELTVGMWTELGYAYKGNEIMERIIVMLNEMLTHCGHHKRHQRVDRLKQKAFEVAGMFVAAQHEYQYGSARPEVVS